jgi:hypothetical protein
MTLVAHGSGDCNVVLYMTDRPRIFDVIRVRVSSIVKPLSPVFLHLGGEVEFKVASTETSSYDDKYDHYENPSNKPRWSTSNPYVLSID